MEGHGPLQVFLSGSWRLWLYWQWRCTLSTLSMSSSAVPVPPQLKKTLIGDQIGSHTVDSLQMLVDEVKESLRQEMVTEFLAINTRMMGKGMDMKESLRWEIMTEINTVLLDAGKDAQEYLHEEMATEIKAALMGIVGGGQARRLWMRKATFSRPCRVWTLSLPGKELILLPGSSMLEKRWKSLITRCNCYACSLNQFKWRW